jgi:DNA-binding NtrC family response regulator
MHPAVYPLCRQIQRRQALPDAVKATPVATAGSNSAQYQFRIWVPSTSKRIKATSAALHALAPWHNNSLCKMRRLALRTSSNKSNLVSMRTLLRVKTSTLLRCGFVLNPITSGRLAVGPGFKHPHASLIFSTFARNPNAGRKMGEGIPSGTGLSSLNRQLKVLIVDDEASQRSGLAAMVSAWGMTGETAGDGNEALAKLNTFQADVIITDLNMPGLDGFGFLERLREAGEMPPTIVLTAFGNIETAVRTVHELGAYWFLEKPLQAAPLEVLLRRAGSHAGLRAENRNLERQLSYKGSLGELVGTSPGMQEIFVLLQQAGPSKACVLITGESGTGKELVARTIHALSPRRQGPFVAINCAALPETLIESELFGHEKGSFTGASERRAGCFEVAQHGTLLLDEIGEMPMQTQAKLLRILEDSRVRRLGGRAEFEVDVRVVAATNKAPDEAVRSGQLREDLYYRLNVFHIHLPPLRERKADIRAIAEALVGDLNRKHECRVADLSPAVLEAFEGHNWPGNVRELRNVLERAVIIAGEGTIELNHLPAFMQGRTGSAPPLAPSAEAAPAPADSDTIRFQIGTTVEDVEKGLILRTLEHTRNNKTRAAEILGISLKTLHNKLKEYGGKEYGVGA